MSVIFAPVWPEACSTAARKASQLASDELDGTLNAETISGAAVVGEEVGEGGGEADLAVGPLTSEGALVRTALVVVTIALEFVPLSPVAGVVVVDVFFSPVVGAKDVEGVPGLPVVSFERTVSVGTIVLGSPFVVDKAPVVPANKVVGRSSAVLFGIEVVPPCASVPGAPVVSDPFVLRAAVAGTPVPEAALDGTLVLGVAVLPAEALVFGAAVAGAVVLGAAVAGAVVFGAAVAGAVVFGAAVAGAFVAGTKEALAVDG